MSCAKFLTVGQLQLKLVALVAVSIGLSAVRAERLKFRCDELELEPLGDDVYCTVSQFFVNFTTVVDCDVYPLERSRVRVIKFYNSHMLFIPAGLLRFFNDVRDMDISRSSIVDIPRSSFEGAKHLVYLTMSQNNVSELRASIFVEATSLFMLDLSHNRIRTVDKFAFVNAQSMSRLILGHNEIEELHAGTFRDMKFLDHVYLNDNRLTSIDPTLFVNNVHLQRIILDNNRILLLDLTVFTKFSHLELIQVSGNQLESINATILPPKFKTLAINNNSLTQLHLTNNVEVLEASNNRLQSLEIEQPITMRTLLLANNNMTDILNITEMVNLENLDLSMNHIGRLNISTLARLKSLTLLNLAQTSIRDLNYGSFAGQRELKVLDLSYNDLNDVNVDILSPYLTRLERLHLDGNNLTEIGGLFQVHLPSLFPALNTLGISNNNFNCTYLTKVLRTLFTFKIKLPVDPDPAGQNGTHVSGIACSIANGHPTSAATALATEHLHGSVGAYAHFAYQRGADNSEDYQTRMWRQQKLLAAIERQSAVAMAGVGNPGGEQSAEFGLLRTRYAESQLHEQLLRENLFTLKLIVALMCVAGLAVVTMKCVQLYRRNQPIGWPPTLPSLYRSTTTMNTLQCSMDVTAPQ